MNARRHQWTTLAVLTVIAAAALSACSSTPAGSTATSPHASVGGGGSTAPTSTPTAAAVSVDLVFTGTLPLTAKGSAGQCTLGHSLADGSILFGFGAKEADYPGLGDGIYLNEEPGSLVLKWLSSVVPSLTFLTDGQGFTYSSDHKSITIDADLQSNVPEHVKGTINCP